MGHLMFFINRKGKNSTQWANNICAVYSECAVSARSGQMWFAQFKVGDFNHINEYHTKTLIDNKPNLENYCSQFYELKTDIQQKRPQITNWLFLASASSSKSKRTSHTTQ